MAEVLVSGVDSGTAMSGNVISPGGHSLMLEHPILFA